MGHDCLNVCAYVNTCLVTLRKAMVQLEME